MDKVYFLIAIGVLALALMFWLVKIERRRSMKAKKQKASVHHMARVHQSHPLTARHGVPSWTSSHPPRHGRAWEQRHQRSGEEMRDGSAITAERIFSDEETPDLDQAHGLAMTAIKFVPEDTPKASLPRR